MRCLVQVSKNSIKDELEAVADVIDCLPSLVAVALRSNPCFRVPSDRRRLMGLLKCFHDIRCKIRFIDKLVTLDEVCSSSLFFKCLFVFSGLMQVLSLVT